MYKTKLAVTIAFVGMLITAPFLLAGDHIDAPAVSGTSSDLSSFYAFEGANTNNLVLVANLQGLLPPGAPTQIAQFDEDVLVEFNIDTTGDLIEDLVIQATKRGDTMYFFGPVVPISAGLQSEIATFATLNKVAISSGTANAEAIIATNNGMQFFAGARDDAFFFDLNRYNAIVSGEVTDFNEIGQDTFAGTNTLSIVIELPKSLLGTGAIGINPNAPTTPIFSMWVETKRKQ
ncbi:MAG: molecular chaperone DnaK [Bacteroidetes bacterium HGW-Bacteroidetes-2]|nr:MAG: molecular chaperone DnaK [Bacteroidetes bacterium HGW-Bacteroidetes-2]